MSGEVADEYGEDAARAFEEQLVAHTNDIEEALSNAFSETGNDPDEAEQFAQDLVAPRGGTGSAQEGYVDPGPRVDR